MSPADARARRAAPWLWVLMSLFAFRVAAQLLQSRAALPVLPPFEDWHSSVVPYGWLLLAQVLILATLAKIALDFSTGRVRPSRLRGWIWLGAGAVYFSIMVLRLALGATLPDADPWFGRTLPALFHLVLAGFVLVVGSFHLRAQ